MVVFSETFQLTTLKKIARFDIADRKYLTRSRQYSAGVCLADVLFVLTMTGATMCCSNRQEHLLFIRIDAIVQSKDFISLTSFLRITIFRLCQDFFRLGYVSSRYFGPVLPICLVLLISGEGEGLAEPRLRQKVYSIHHSRVALHCVASIVLTKYKIRKKKKMFRFLVG